MLGLLNLNDKSVKIAGKYLYYFWEIGFKVCEILNLQNAS